MEDEIEGGGGESQLPPTRLLHHIKKRALKNKSLSISFDEKQLKDYVTGFHKRKNKRRKEALKQQEEVLRRKRIEGRKKRKLEREHVLYGGAPPSGPASERSEEHNEEDEEYDMEDEESEPVASANAMTMYDNGDVKVTVTTSEISRDNGDGPGGRSEAAAPRSRGADAKHVVAVNKKKTFKKAPKRKFHGKHRNGKRDNNKGNRKNKKR